MADEVNPLAKHEAARLYSFMAMRPPVSAPWGIGSSEYVRFPRNWIALQGLLPDESAKYEQSVLATLRAWREKGYVREHPAMPGAEDMMVLTDEGRKALNAELLDQEYLEHPKPYLVSPVR
jgi:hypothetical protein